jgi:outer membrane lipoprotein-sorting protein
MTANTSGSPDASDAAAVPAARTAADDGTAGPRTGRRLVRYAVPFAVVGVAAGTIGLVPALADSGDPDLPKLTAQQLVGKMAASDVEQRSGTVQLTTDLGLPDFSGLTNLVSGSTAPGGAHKDASGGSAADPSSKLLELASGTHTLRVAQDGPDRQKLSILENASEYSVIHNGDQLWAYDSASNEAYHAKPGAAASQKDRKQDLRKPGAKGDLKAPTPEELARQSLQAAGKTTSVTVDGTERVAGRDAYRLVIKPKQSGSTVGAISIAADAKNFTPLKFTLTPAGGGPAVVDVGYVKVDFSKPSASTFAFTPPKGTKVTEGGTSKSGQGMPGLSSALKGLLPGADGAKGANGAPKTIGKGWSAITEFGGPASSPGAAGSGSSGTVPPDAQGLLGSIGDRTHGAFGSGTLFSTRLVNALITDDGRVYAGMVTKDALVKAANAAH